MKISDIMSVDVSVVRPDQTVQQAAKIMADIDAGAVPVATEERLVGIVTDRDLAVRVTAKGLGPTTKISEAMSQDIKYCFEDDDVEAVAENMSDIQVRRLPVVNREKRLVGIVALGDIARATSAEAGTALAGISQPTRQHSQ
jgi:CBS domain-containing protein